MEIHESIQAIVEGLIDGRLTVREASDLLKVHRTTVWRLCRKWRQNGSDALRHGLAGRRSNRSKSDSFRRQVCELYVRDYKPHGHSVFSFYQSVARGLQDYVCYSTVLDWLREEGLIEPAREMVSF